MEFLWSRPERSIAVVAHGSFLVSLLAAVLHVEGGVELALKTAEMRTVVVGCGHKVSADSKVQPEPEPAPKPEVAPDVAPEPKVGVEPAPEPAREVSVAEAGEKEAEEPPKKKKKTAEAADGTPPSLSGSWAVTGKSASSGAFRYTMTLEESDGRVTGEVKTQDMCILGAVDHATGKLSFTQTISGKGGKVNTCTATLSGKRSVVMAGEYKSSGGSNGTFTSKKRK